MIEKSLQDKIIFGSQLTAKEIIKIFSYDEEEKDAFSYLRRYMKLVEKRIDEIEKDEEKLKRFALAGLFLTYRAYNHIGISMETANFSEIDFIIHSLRLRAFRDYFKDEIKDTSNYLEMLNFSVFHYLMFTFRLKSLPRKLCKFVVK